MKRLVPVLALVLFAAAAAYGQNANVIPVNEDDRPLKILKKPRASFSDDCQTRSGVTRLRVTFDRSARITATEMVRPSGCDAFDRNAVRAAARIKFMPAVKDGQPVTVVRLVEYNFNVH